MTVLINYIGKFYYRHGHFQNTEAANKGVLKIFTKLRGKHLCQSLFFNKPGDLIPAKGETATRLIFYELCEIFKNNFFASYYFLKYKSLNMIPAGYICLVKSYSENVLENIQEHICIRLQVTLSYKFRKIKDWLNPHND